MGSDSIGRFLLVTKRPSNTTPWSRLRRPNRQLFQIA
ncbi:MAG: hypothetical protein ACI9BW_004041, partial [Gammaproteobacteria bacterium]